MKYTIYEMVRPSILAETEYHGYYIETVYRDVLEILNVSGVEEEHLTLESAVAEIESKKEVLKGLRLTILPVFEISYNGEII